MKNKFEKLSLAKFSSSAIGRTEMIFGGYSTDIPDGGSSCSTGAGTRTFGNGDSINYSSDTEIYNGDGSYAGGEYHVGGRIGSAPGGGSNAAG